MKTIEEENRLLVKEQLFVESLLILRRHYGECKSIRVYVGKERRRRYRYRRMYEYIIYY